MRISRFTSGWRGAALVAATYIYFLIFAQFGFVARLSELGMAGDALKMVMAAMAAGGVACSLLTARFATRFSAAAVLRAGFAVCGAAAASTIVATSSAALAVIALAIGVGLSMVTVGLVTNLRAWAGADEPILRIGLGCGVAYFVCNVPVVFTASPEQLAIFATAICAAGVGIAWVEPDAETDTTQSKNVSISLPRAIATFAALVWLDSAAFYIIQHTAALKSGTWLGNVHLWTNGCIHLVAAVAAAVLLRAGRVGIVLCSAMFALGFACILLLSPALALPASLFYPAGVSLYSVALVAYPSFLSKANTRDERARDAGWIYAAAGWIGSALGIGMGEHLGHIPPAFVAVGGAVVFVPAVLSVVRMRSREVSLLAGVSLAAFAIYHLLPHAASQAASSPIERGRQVYISEGCISCHSQYVRPTKAEELMWGPTQSMKAIHAQKPPLIGNRRQGPDLSQVGARRSTFWLKAHLTDPDALSYHSAMPSYAFLFDGTRGDDLVAYLASLRGPADAVQRHYLEESTWHPSPDAVAQADSEEGEKIYAHECASCHEAGGAARLRWGSSFQPIPANLDALRSHAQVESDARIAQISRFGIANTEMPGHEYLSDREIASLTLYLKQQSVHPVPHS